MPAKRSAGSAAGRAFIDARYEYNWNPLLGSLAGALRLISRAASTPEIGAATGAAGLPPRVETTVVEGEPVAFAPQADPLRLPPGLVSGLAALGADATLHVIDEATNWPGLRRRILRRRMRRELGAGRPIVASAGGIDPFGLVFGLIVGYDDERRAWRRDGQMTAEVSPWLSEAEWAAQPRIAAVRLRPGTGRDDGDVLSAAESAAVVADAETRIALDLWIAVFESGTPIDAQGHARAAQALAAGRGELAEFWRGAGGGETGRRASELSVALSRFATMFPWPMGGAPNSAGVRAAAAAVLREAAATLAA